MADNRLFFLCIVVVILWLVGAMACMVLWLVTGNDEWEVRGVLMFVGYLFGKMAQVMKQEGL